MRLNPTSAHTRPRRGAEAETDKENAPINEACRCQEVVQLANPRRRVKVRKGRHTADRGEGRGNEQLQQQLQRGVGGGEEGVRRAMAVKVEQTGTTAAATRRISPRPKYNDARPQNVLNSVIFEHVPTLVYCTSMLQPAGRWGVVEAAAAVTTRGVGPVQRSASTTAATTVAITAATVGGGGVAFSAGGMRRG